MGIQIGAVSRGYLVSPAHPRAWNAPRGPERPSDSRSRCSALISAASGTRAPDYAGENWLLQRLVRPGAIGVSVTIGVAYGKHEEDFFYIYTAKTERLSLFAFDFVDLVNILTPSEHNKWVSIVVAFIMPS